MSRAVSFVGCVTFDKMNRVGICLHVKVALYWIDTVKNEIFPRLIL
jgi:hypothetical protein